MGFPRPFKKKQSLQRAIRKEFRQAFREAAGAEDPAASRAAYAVLNTRLGAITGDKGYGPVMEVVGSTSLFGFLISAAAGAAVAGGLGLAAPLAVPLVAAVTLAGGILPHWATDMRDARNELAKQGGFFHARALYKLQNKVKSRIKRCDKALAREQSGIAASAALQAQFDSVTGKTKRASPAAPEAAAAAAPDKMQVLRARAPRMKPE